MTVRIIKEGVIKPKVYPVFRGTCPSCGCVFEKTGPFRNDTTLSYVFVCPMEGCDTPVTCKKVVYRNK